MTNDFVGIDTMMKIKELVNSPLGSATRVVVTDDIVVLVDKVVSLYGYSRNMRGVVPSNFGKGNQSWTALISLDSRSEAAIAGFSMTSNQIFGW